MSSNRTKGVPTAIYRLRNRRTDVRPPDVPVNATPEQMRKVRRHQMWWRSRSKREAAFLGTTLDEYLANELRRDARWAHGLVPMRAGLREKLGLDAIDEDAPVVCAPADRFGVPLDPKMAKMLAQLDAEAREAARSRRNLLSVEQRIAFHEALNPKRVNSMDCNLIRGRSMSDEQTQSSAKLSGNGRKVYWATVSDNGRAVGVSFHDFPGCVASEATYDAAIASAHAALDSHTRGEALPEPTPRDVVEAHEDADNEDSEVLTYVPIVLVDTPTPHDVRILGPGGNMNYTVPGDVQDLLARMLAPYGDDPLQSGP